MRTLGRVSIDQFFFLFFYYCHSLRGIILACPGEVKKKKGFSVELQQLELVVNKPFGV